MLTTCDGQADAASRKAMCAPMGRGASGVRGMKLKSSDMIVGMDVMSEGRKGINC